MTESNDDAAAMPKISGLLLGGIFFLPLCLDIATLLLVAAGVILVGRMAWNGRVKIRRTRLDIWLAGFAILAAASAPGSIFAYESWYNYYHVVSLYLLVYFLVTQSVLSDADVKKTLLVILASAAIVCMVGLFQYATGVDVTAERWIDGEQFPQLKTRVFSTLGNPNVLAAFLVMIIGLSTGLIMDQGTKHWWYALIGLTLLAGFCLVLTYSRGAWLAAVLMACVTALAWRRPGWRVLAGSTLALSLLFYLAHDTLTGRLLSIFDMFNSNDSSVALRWALLEITFAMIQEQPWLGIGWGVYPYVFPYYDFFIRDETVMIYHAHNSLLSIAAEIGVPGMLCFVAACGSAAGKMLRQIRQGKAGKGRQFGVVLAMIGLAAYSLTDHVLFNIQVAADFWAMLAIAACMPESGETGKPVYWIDKKFPGLAGFFSLH